MVARAPAREPPADLLAPRIPRRPLRRRRLLATAAAVVVFAVGVAAGLALAVPAERPQQRAPVPVGPGPWRVEQGVPVGYAQTEAGAVSAAATYASVFGDKRLLDSEVARQTLGVFMAPPLVEAQLAGFPDAGGLVDDPGYAQRIQPLGYRVAAFTGDRAVIDLWLVILGEGDPAREQIAWSTDTLTLNWVDGDWSVIGIDGADGPTPTPAAPGDAAAAMNSFAPFVLQPRAAS